MTEAGDIPRFLSYRMITAMDRVKHVIELCMGSSCYSRGNGRSVQIIEEYVQKKNCEESVRIQGRLCSGQCADGPCITIDGTDYTGVTPDSVGSIVRSHIREADDG